MKRISYSLVWAAAIIVASIVAASSGLSDGASFAVVIGLSGAAWASLHADGACSRGCLQ